MATFSERLIEALSIRHITSAELSRRTQISEGTISQYRSGKYKAAQINLEKIALALRVSIPWLMGAEDVPMEDNIKINNILPLPEIEKVPLIGDIACGLPILAEDNIEGYIPSNTDLHADFCLRCSGDSLINDRIFDGDIVWIRKQPEVKNGEIAAVRIDNEATLKHVLYYPDKVILRASNPIYKDIILNEDQDIEIIGKAIAFYSEL